MSGLTAEDVAQLGPLERMVLALATDCAALRARVEVLEAKPPAMTPEEVTASATAGAAAGVQAAVRALDLAGPVECTQALTRLMASHDVLRARIATLESDVQRVNLQTARAR